MIPILFDRYETSFTTNGIGRLSDCISFTVTEERNGIYEAEFEYPITGQYYKYIEHGSIVYATHDDTGDPQPFEVYAHSAVINGIVTFYAHHISYKLNNIVVEPFTASSCAEAIQFIKTKSINTNDFTFWTDKATTGAFESTLPKVARALLGGEEGSLLDVYGSGDYEWDHFNVKLHADRGQDTQVEIRYRKNMIDLNDDVDSSSLFDAVVPYWQGTEENEQTGELEEVVVMLPEKIVASGVGLLANEDLKIIQNQNSIDIEVGGESVRTVPLDLTDIFEEKPTAAQLRAAAQSYLANAKGWVPVENLKVDFVQLWQTEEYAEYAPLQRVRLCDRVSVYFPEMGVVKVKQRVIKTVFNVLLDRYDSIELGELQTTLGQEIRDSLDLGQYVTRDQLNGLEVDLTNLTESLKEQIDEKIQTWYQSTDPSYQWSTAELKAAHVGDLWCYTGVTLATREHLSTWRYTVNNGVYSWEAYDATAELFDAVDHKTTIFYGAPSGSYPDAEIGDYLVDSTDGSTYRWSGLTWIKQTDYNSAINSMESTLNTAITNATQKITGAQGGYVYMKPDANGYPQEILIMNSQYYNAATKIWRWNINGLGYSDHGYAGPYGTAITMDGSIVADYITTGTLNANIIKAGVLQDSGSNTSFDLSTGTLTIRKGSINLGNGKFTVDNFGNVYASSVQLGASTTVEEYGLSMEHTDASGEYRASYSFSGIEFERDTPSYKYTHVGEDEIRKDDIFLANDTGAWLGGVDSTDVCYMSDGSDLYAYVSDTTVTTKPNLRLTTDKQLRLTTHQNSSKKIKKDITTKLGKEVDPRKLYDVEVVQFRYNDKVNLDENDDRYGKDLIGFVVEDLNKVYPLAVDKDGTKDSEHWSWNEAYIIPPMLKLIQDQHKQIDELRTALDEIKLQLAALKERG